MKIFLNFASFLAIIFFLNACGKDTKQTQSSLTTIEDEKKFALTLYGDEVKVIAKGDLLGNGKQSAIAAIVMKQTDNSYWIKRGSFMQKESDGWKVLLKMEDKISNTKGNLVEQVDAKNGYIIKFDTTKKPVTINIVMANEYGKSTSDEAEIKWNDKTNNFEFASPNSEIPQ
jgi:ketosteroid isomerase-like protein